MDEPLKDILDRNRDELVSGIDINDSFLNKLLSRKVLNNYHYSAIKAKNTPESQIQALLDILKRRNNDSYHIFLEELFAQGQTDLVRKCLPDFGGTDVTPRTSGQNGTSTLNEQVQYHHKAKMRNVGDRLPASLELLEDILYLRNTNKLPDYLDCENGLTDALRDKGTITEDEFILLQKKNAREQAVWLTSWCCIEMRQISNGNEEDDESKYKKYKKKQNQIRKLLDFREALHETKQDHVVNLLTLEDINSTNVRPLTENEIRPLDEAIYNIQKLSQMQMIPDLVRNLYYRHAITTRHKDRVLDQKGNSEKALELLRIMKRRSYADLMTFDQCLHELLQANIPVLDYCKNFIQRGCMIEVC